jgi:hypothetical protein
VNQLDLLDKSGIAKMLGKSKQAIAKMQKRGDLPKADGHVNGEKEVWRVSRIERLRSTDVANGSGDTGNPVKFGGLAKTSNSTAVSDGQRVNALFSKHGKQIVSGSLRELKGRQVTTITDTSGHTIVNAVVSTYCDLYGLILTNTGASATKVTVSDGTTSTIFYVPAGETRGFMLPESGA